MPIEIPKGGCLFCERVSGERDDWAVLDEDELMVSFMNDRQFEEGQALVIPRRHAPTLLDLTDEESDALLRSVRRLARAITEAFDPGGITLYQNNGVASNQEIPHLHMNVVPRRYGGGWGEGPPHIAALTRAEREARFQRRAGMPWERVEELAALVRQQIRS
jgi:histidine triad (HIT) family protein